MVTPIVTEIRRHGSPLPAPTSHASPLVMSVGQVVRVRGTGARLRRNEGGILTEDPRHGRARTHDVVMV